MENQHERNEPLDCAVYAYAAKEFVRPNLRELRSKLLAKVEALAARGQLVSLTPGPAIQVFGVLYGITLAADCLSFTPKAA